VGSECGNPGSQAFAIVLVLLILWYQAREQGVIVLRKIAHKHVLSPWLYHSMQRCLRIYGKTQENQSAPVARGARKEHGALARWGGMMHP